MRTPSSGDSVSRNAVFALAAQLTTAAFTAALTLYLARALGAEQYGVLALAIGIGLVTTLPADFGVSASAARFIAERRGNRHVVAAILADALRIKLCIATISAAALAALAAPIAAAFGIGGLTWPLRAAAVAMLGQSTMMLFSASFTALGRVALYWRAVLTESAVEASTSVALVALGAGVTGAALGRATGYAVGAAVAIAIMVRALGRRTIAERKQHRHVGLSQLAQYAGWLFIIDGAFTLFQVVDILVIGAFIGPSAVGVFQAPARLMTVLQYPGLAVASGVAPRVARDGSERSNRTELGPSLRLLVILQVATIAPILIWASPILNLLLGPGYGDSASVLRAFVPYVLMAGLGPLLSLSINYLGEARRRVRFAIAAVLLNLVVDIVLVPKIGVVAGAIGTDAAYALYLAAHLWILRDLISLALKPLFVTVLRCLVAAGTVALLLWAVGTLVPGVAGYALGAVLGGAIYLLVLIGTRELSIHEVQSAGRLVTTATAKAVGAFCR